MIHGKIKDLMNQVDQLKEDNCRMKEYIDRMNKRMTEQEQLIFDLTKEVYQMQKRVSQP